jgi:hypothetical protein
MNRRALIKGLMGAGAAGALPPPAISSANLRKKAADIVFAVASIMRPPNCARLAGRRWPTMWLPMRG